MSPSISSRLTMLAHARLLSDLSTWGNVLSTDHQAALSMLMGDFTAMANGDLTGRHAWGLPTGAGKSAAVVSWIAAVAKLGTEAEGISVAVAASKVEALCEMKRALIAHGVSPEDISLRHSFRYDERRTKAGHVGYASEPSDTLDRRFVLVSHSRVQGTSSGFMEHKGKPRSLLIWDESLLTSSPTGLSVADIRGAIGWLSGFYAGSDRHRELITHLQSLQGFITTTLAGLTTDEDSKVIEVPSHPKAEEWVPLVGTVDAALPILSLLEMAGKSARLVRAGGQGLLSYQVSVPPSFGNIIVLDASYPIRQLERLDPSILDAAQRHVALPSILQGIKRFHKVILHHMKAHGGRVTMTREFFQKRHNGTAFREVVSVIKQIPKDQSILVFVYKSRGGLNGGDFARTLTDALQREGIDTEQEATHPPGQTFDSPRKRINVLTWGNEAGTNSFNHCSNVILAGILHRSHIDLMASTLGQSDNIHATIPTDLFRSVEVGEKVHLAYQALSRGTCRMVNNGEAAPMQGWIIEQSPNFREALGTVMPGVIWQSWGDTLKDNKSQTAQVAQAIVAWLKTFPGEKVSTIKIRRMLRLDTKVDTFAAGIVKALEAFPEWRKEGRSLVRLTFAPV